MAQPSDVRAVKNSLAGVWGYLVPSFVSLATTPYILHHLGSSTYGLWMLSNAVVGYLLIYRNGLVEGVVKCMSDAINQVGSSGAAKVVGTGVTILGTIALMILALAFVLAPHVPGWFSIGRGSSLLFTEVIVLTALCLVPTLLSVPYSAVLAGLQRFDIISLLNVCSTAGSPILSCLVLYYGGGLEHLIEAGIVVSTISLVVIVLAARKLRPDVGVRPGWEPTVVRQVGRFTFYSVITSSAANIAWLSDDSLIGMFSGMSAVAYYSIPLGVAFRVWQIASGVAQMLTPMTIEANADPRRERVCSMLILWNRTLSFSFLAACIGLLYAGPSLLSVWLGSGFAAHAGTAFRLQSLAVAGIVVSVPSYYVLNGIGRPEANMYGVLLGSALMLVLLPILVRRYGIIGASGAVSAFAVGMAMLPFIVLEEFFQGAKARSALYIWGIPLGTFAVMGVALRVLWWDLERHTVLGVISYGISAASIYLGLCFAAEVIFGDCLVVGLCKNALRVLWIRDAKQYV